MNVDLVLRKKRIFWTSDLAEFYAVLGDNLDRTRAGLSGLSAAATPLARMPALRAEQRTASSITPTIDAER